MAGTLTRRTVALGAVQSAEGAAATPSQYLDGLLISDISYTVDGEVIQRNFLRDALSPLPHRVGRKLFEVTFNFELRGAPRIGARPEWGWLMRAAQMSETFAGAVVTSIRTAALKWTVSPVGGAGVYYVDLQAGGDPSLTLPQSVRENGKDLHKAATGPANLAKGQWWYGDGDTLGFSTVYVHLSDDADPDSKALGFVETVASATTLTYEFEDTTHEYATVDIYPDGLLIHCVDALADITGIQFNAGGIPTCSARIRSAYANPTDVALPAPVNYHSHLPPLAESMAFTLNPGTPFSTGVLPAFNLNFGNQLAERRDLNSAFGYKGTRHVGRAPAGTATFEQELVGTFPFFTHLANAQVMTWSATMGTAGTRLTLSSPGLVFTSVRSGDAGGIRTLEVGFNLTQPALVKEFKILLD